MEYAISLQSVSKSFRTSPGSTYQLRDLLLLRRRPADRRTVLQSLDLQVRPGEAVGLVGRNGCGKSTVLKLVSRILYPDAGTVTLNGRVSALLELGAGFHPDLTGIENIRTNAAIFGLTRAETDRRLDDIIRFSELGSRIREPVRTYSSGMYMRLAFSVAVHVDSDILLIDEILAVGDAAFQEKCFARLQEIPGLKIFGPAEGNRGGAVSFTLDCVHPHDVADILGSRNVCVRAGHHCAMPLHERFHVPATTRASLYIYNSEQDIDCLCEALMYVYKLFG